MILKVVILIVLVNFRSSLSQVLSCSYRNNDTYGYTCDLIIQNPNGLNNFASIGGTHMSGKTNNDVQRVLRVEGSNTTNVPSVICDKFQNVNRIEMYGIGIQIVDDKAFKNCKKLQVLNLYSNKITSINEKAFTENLELLTLRLQYNQLSELSENVFKSLQKLKYLGLYTNKLSDLPKNIFNSLQKLTTLYLKNNQLKNPRIEWFLTLGNLQALWLEGNQIEELPRNIFLPLKNLNTILLNNNKLKVIQSDPFWGVSNLKTIHLENNQIEAIDENLIDNTGVEYLDLNFNLCVKQDIFDNSTSRMTMRLALQNCFKNFDDLLPARMRKLEEDFYYSVAEFQEQIQQFTSIANELQAKVSNLTADNVKIREGAEEMQDQIEALSKENEDQNSLIKDQGLIIESQESKITELQDNQDTQAKNLEELKYLVYELQNRPCACK